MTAPTFSSSQVRQDFLDFFRAKGHTIVPSAPLVPGNDPTLLFTNSGMVQFKDVFLGAEKRSYVRAADVQRCLRAGGKHNDLDSVGYTARHHTFFEMLGNWSFGDYFKKEAIAWAWELLTQVWKLPAERLLVTVYHTDDEAYALWRDVVGVPAERIVRIGDNKGAPFASDNFWQMADTGPCGPCTEIFYDHGDHIAGGPPGSPDEDGDRFIEIWNLVFMQFDRQPDGSLVPLPAPCVDTGMGLERLAAILQHVHTNYEIDLFQALIRKAAELTGTADLENKSLRVIADHIRACSFLIVDGVLPSNEGRGYVLRRIIRRALRHGWMLGVRQPFFSKLVPTLVEQMGEAYPELPAAVDTVTRALQRRGRTFCRNPRRRHEASSRTWPRKAATACIPGVDAFRLYDTYGFPLDLTRTSPASAAWTVDIAGFDAAMEQQRQTARAAGKFGGGVTALPAELVATAHARPRFLGYDQPAGRRPQTVLALLQGRPPGAVGLAAGGRGHRDAPTSTPFYAESGGQVGDTGRACRATACALAVGRHLRSSPASSMAMSALCPKARLKVGDVLAGQVDGERRGATILNHSATHLLHAALRAAAGHPRAAEGLAGGAGPPALRLLALPAGEPAEELAADRAPGQPAGPRQPRRPRVHTMGMQEALDFGAMALFGEKYGEHVRVLQHGRYLHRAVRWHPRAAAPATSACSRSPQRKRRCLGRRAPHRGGDRPGRAGLCRWRGASPEPRPPACSAAARPRWSSASASSPSASASWSASWKASRPRPLPAPPPTWPARRSRWTASRSWRRAWKASTPRPCAMQWTASSSSWATP